MKQFSFPSLIFFALLFSLYYANCSPAEDESADAPAAYNRAGAGLTCLEIDSTQSEGGGIIVLLKVAESLDSLFSAQIVLKYANEAAQVVGFWENAKIENESNPYPYTTAPGAFYFSYFPQQTQSGPGQYNTFSLDEGERLISIAFDQHPGKIAIPINPNGREECNFAKLQNFGYFWLTDIYAEICK
jgi:hypothetical protein